MIKKPIPNINYVHNFKEQWEWLCLFQVAKNFIVFMHKKFNIKPNLTELES